MADGLVNYNILKPELATSFAQGFQNAQTQGLRQQAAKQQLETEKMQLELTQEKVTELRREREQMLQLQQKLVAQGQNPDLNFVFDTMIQSGIPDYVTRGVEGKRKLDEQKQFARIMGLETNAPSPTAAPTNALASTVPSAPPATVGEGTTPAPTTVPTPTVAPRNALTNASEVDRLTKQINGLLALGTPQAIQAASVLERQLALANKSDVSKMISVGEKSSLYDPTTKTWITPPRALGGETEIPKLKQGERWNAKLGRVEAVEGSDIYKKQKSAFATDYKATTAVTDKMDEAIKKADDILSPKNASGFAGNFGGYNAYATQMLPGENTDMRKKIDSFKSTLKSAGLELMRQGGAIGQMTVQEWPIVEQMIDSISPALSENQAKQAFAEIRARFDRIRSRAKDVYETEYSDSQFYKPITSLAGGASGATKPASTGKWEVVR